MTYGNVSELSRLAADAAADVSEVPRLVAVDIVAVLMRGGVGLYGDRLVD